MESLDVKIEDLGNLKRKIIVTVPSEIVREAYNKTYLSLKDKISINGFRKGKFPQSLLEKRFQKVMRNEAIETLVPEYYEKAIKQENLKPAVRPQFDDLEVEKSKPLVFSAAFEIYPEFDLPEYSVYGLEKKEAEFTAEEVAEQRKRHLDNASTFSPKAGAAEEGDQIVMEFNGKVDEESIAEAKDHKYILGSKEFLPEFETALSGMKKDEEKNFDLTFPSDYNEEKLQGKNCAILGKNSRNQPDTSSGNERRVLFTLWGQSKVGRGFQSIRGRRSQVQKRVRDQGGSKKNCPRQTR